jgi:hypothetical protein
MKKKFLKVLIVFCSFTLIAGLGFLTGAFINNSKNDTASGDITTLNIKAFELYYRAGDYETINEILKSSSKENREENQLFKSEDNQLLNGETKTITERKIKNIKVDYAYPYSIVTLTNMNENEISEMKTNLNEVCPLYGFGLEAKNNLEQVINYFNIKNLKLDFKGENLTVYLGDGAQIAERKLDTKIGFPFLMGSY